MKIPRGTLQKNKFHYQFSLTNTRPYTRFIFHVTLPVSLPVPAQNSYVSSVAAARYAVSDVNHGRKGCRKPTS